MKWFTIAGVFVGTMAFSSAAVFAAASPPLGQSNDVNLALGKSYTTSASVPDVQYSYYEKAWFPHVDSVLTDGQFAQPFFYEPDWSVNPNWQAFVLQDEHNVTVDLGQVDAVHQIMQDFMNDPKHGVYLPEHVVFSVSVDGQSWKQVGNVSSPIALTTQSATSAQYVQDHLNIQARYIRADFPTTFYAFSDELEVMGQPGIVTGSAAPTADNLQSSPESGYATLTETNGVNDILLTPLWLASKYNQTIYPWNLTAKQWLPLVSYMDPQGNIKDWMFSSVLASRGAGTSNLTQADWQTWIDHLFSLGQYGNSGTKTELPALDDAVGIAQSALHDATHKENVIISIPYPDPAVTNWGTLNGKTLDFTSESDRQEAVAWFIQQVEEAWQQAGFHNLNLAGFYWENEAVYVNQPGEVHLIRSTADTIHQLSQKFYWIPYFEAPGYKIWSQLGFDAAMLQPNYSFSNAGQNRLTEAAELAHHYGLGVEMEFPNRYWDPTSSNGTNAYLSYQDAALAYHFQSGVPLAWYQGTQSLLRDYQQNRLLYDSIHQFLTGTYSPVAYQNVDGTYQLEPVQPNLESMTPLNIPMGLDQLQGNLLNDNENGGGPATNEPNTSPSQFAHQETPHQQAQDELMNGAN